MIQPKPNKNLGQHWLHDPDALEAICNEAHLLPTDTVLEIGPGLGTLTKHVAARVKKIIALEFDPRLAQGLQQQLPAANVEVLQGDILTFDLSQLPRGYKVVANVPYYITSKIIRLLLTAAQPPVAITLLVQKEVAQRIAAQPGNMSVLAVSVQFYCEVMLGPVVPARLFTPPPEVDSQIITLIKRGKPLFDDIDVPTYFKVVRAGFGEKRKKLRNSLSGGLQLDKPTVEGMLKAAGLATDARAEQLTLQDWYALTKIFAKEPND